MDKNPEWPYVEIYRSENRQDVMIKQSILESEGIDAAVKQVANPALGSGWGMPVGMEDRMKLFILYVDNRQEDHSRDILDDLINRKNVSDAIEGNTGAADLFCVLLDRNHSVIYGDKGFPRDSIEESFDPRHFLFTGSSENGSGTYQFFIAKKSSNKLGLPSSDFRWQSLSTVLETEKDNAFFDSYCDVVLGGYKPPAGRLSAMTFGLDKLDANYYGNLVSTGTMKGRTSVREYTDSSKTPFPSTGDIRIVLDNRGNPLAAIRIQDVEEHPFGSVPLRFITAEGEGYATPESWRKGRGKYLKREARAAGSSLTAETAVICETFECIHLFSRE